MSQRAAGDAVSTDGGDTISGDDQRQRRGGPLSGIRILSLGSYLAGNHVSFLLSLYCAEIIKFERPGVGDALRGPPSAVGHSNNKQQNKRSVTVDLDSEAGRELFLSMVDRSDVVFTNQKPTSLLRHGITFDALQAVNPQIIYATLSAFGHDDVVGSGPFGGWPAFDVIAQGLAGLQYRCLGQNDDSPGYNGIPLGDDGTAILTAFGIVLALRARDQSGSPQRVDVAMHDSMLYYNRSPSIVGRLKARWRRAASRQRTALHMGLAKPATGG